ncbi:TPA: hypothetical protein NHQ39_006012 [Pseudomonas aeruginosa]|nr:hypothetical protein [Pseudomonas aeruginosa]HCE7300484.1 hypothetical protein [Pseudomonas aeruginosa]
MKFLEKLKKRKERKYFRGWEKIFKAPEKIRLAYPHYEVGVGTYGIPEVTEFGDKATLRIGAYTSIAAGVKILLGGNPARQIRWRFEEDIREALLASAWWDWPVDEVKQVARTLCSTDMTAFLRYIEQRKG